MRKLYYVSYTAVNPEGDIFEGEYDFFDEIYATPEELLNEIASYLNRGCKVWRIKCADE